MSYLSDVLIIRGWLGGCTRADLAAATGPMRFIGLLDFIRQK